MRTPQSWVLVSILVVGALSRAFSPSRASSVFLGSLITATFLETPNILMRLLADLRQDPIDVREIALYNLQLAGALCLLYCRERFASRLAAALAA
jgi:hypothetical protein